MKLTVSQLAAKVGKSERTVKRWLNGENQKIRLAARDLGNGMYEVDQVDLQRLSKHEFSTAALDALERIEENQQEIVVRMERLEKRLFALEALLSAQPVKQVARAVRMVRTDIQPLPTFGSDESSEGLEIATVFAQRHLPLMAKEQIARLVQTVRENGSVLMVAGKYKHGKATASYALNAQGKHAFWEVMHTRGGFEACDDCPHD